MKERANTCDQSRTGNGDPFDFGTFRSPFLYFGHCSSFGTIHRSLFSGRRNYLHHLAIVLTATFTAAPQITVADVMMFHGDGSVSASGWTFHATPPDSVNQIGAPQVAGRGEPRQTHSRAVSAPTRTGILNAVRKTAARHELNSALRTAGIGASEWHILFRSLIQAESAFNQNALSPKGAIGLGQLMPDTARHLGVNPHDMQQNLDGAARYLLAQLSRFGSVELALAAYNAGPHRVEEYRGVPPFRETKHYIARINHLTGGLVAQRVAIAAVATSTQNTPRSAVVLK